MSDHNGSAPKSDSVLLCYDGSRESANAITRAGELLGPRPATVVTVWSGLSSLMLHAPLAGPPRGPLAEGAEMIDEPERERAERQAAEGADAASAAGFEASPLALEEDGNVWHTLRRHAAERDYAVVVVGAQGRSRIATVLLGGVSSGLVHHAPVPVLMVPGAADSPPLGPIVFCDDGSHDARRAIALGRRLLQGRGVVLSLWHSWVVNVPYMVVGAGMAVGMAQEIDQAEQERAEDTAIEGSAAAAAIAGDCEALAVRFDGPDWRGLLDAANDREAAAIVVGSRGLAGIARTLGSVSAAICQHSPRPVMVVPPIASNEEKP